MPLKRIISRLDIKGPNLVKGINLEGLRVLGNPDFFFKNYYNTGADEIIYHDCVASLYEKKYLLDFIDKASSNVFIPVSVGGGIKTLRDIELILKNGADKVFINSAAIKKPRFLDEAVKNFGSSTISIDSSLGFEALSRSNKVGLFNFFSYNDKSFFSKEFFKKDGNFFLGFYNKHKINKILEYLYTVDNKVWKNQNFDKMNQVPYVKNNSKLNKVVKSII